ncbi:MAG: hypothetical protein O3C10_08015 [Chloroflexi bacterium]|nr:hypothetical protein [Chloroflexota bacterium]
MLPNADGIAVGEGDGVGEEVGTGAAGTRVGVAAGTDVAGVAENGVAVGPGATAGAVGSGVGAGSSSPPPHAIAIIETAIEAGTPKRLAMSTHHPPGEVSIASRLCRTSLTMAKR